MRTGFVTVAGRPNVGKSSLVNRMVGTKVTITSPRPNTTRHRIRGVLHRPDAQVVFVDTPGLHRPRTALGRRLNDAAAASLDDVDLVVALVDATAAIGPGDRLVLQRALGAAPSPGEPPGVLVAVNKIDRAGRGQVLERLASAAATVEELAGEAGETWRQEGVEYFPVSALTGTGVDELVRAVVARLPDGPPYYPEGVVSDTPEALQVAELVREQLLRRVREELPHSIACRVTEWEWPLVRCEILVERASQKAIVIGAGGEVLRAVGTAVRAQLDPGVYLDLVVRVEKHWQQRHDVLDRLGY
ncbi:MAG TPA: GTPase Era [Acidimicrobiales bacterium]|nr:GTPase Era [Acidimicrobiales bacterium]